MRAGVANSHPISLQSHNLPEQSEVNGRCWFEMDLKETLSGLHYISDTHSCNIPAGFPTAVTTLLVFSVTSYEAILQLPDYDNSILWPAGLVGTRPDRCFLLGGQQQNFPSNLSKN